jgi:hypothetical protein
MGFFETLPGSFTVKQKKSCIPVLALLLGIMPAAEASEIVFNIRYFDKRVYYLETDPIYVQVTVSNGGPDTYRFKLADDRIFSVDFEVRTTSNRAVEAAGLVVRKRSENHQVFFREIAVESGESFSFVEDIRDYADLRQSGSFIVQAKMYPELYRRAGETQSSPVLESNRLSLNLRPPALPGPGGVPVLLDRETNALLVREKLPPDEVVTYHLTAWQRSQWEKYFLYFDLEAMLVQDSVRRRNWLAENQEGRRRMIANYRTELQKELTEGEFILRPMEFAVERTVYGAFEGTVTVLEKFKIGSYIERKRYTYDLRRQDDIWTIVNYTVQNLGTE